ncbi:MAG: hypothetical protein ACHQJ6_03075 [Candidatus Berkiellales bacterium]
MADDDDNGASCGNSQHGERLVKLGDLYQGGIVFYVESPDKHGCGSHGLIEALQDQATAVQWAYLIGSATHAVDDALYAGKRNTTWIIALDQRSAFPGTDAVTIAAGYRTVANGSACKSFPLVLPSGSGPTELCYNDWYLPSAGELALMIEEASILSSASCPSCKPFSVTTYWSSTAVDLTNALVVKTSPAGAYNTQPMSNLYGVRAVRSF